MRIAVLAASIFALAACGDGAEVSPDGPSSERFTLRPLGSMDGAPNGYVEYLPPGYGDRTPRPLLLFFHGAGENGDGSEGQLERLFDTAIPTLIQNGRWPEERPFIVLVPQHEGGEVAGSLCPDADEIESFISFATEHYDVDRRRVYLTGLSCGAIGAWQYPGAYTTARDAKVFAAGVLNFGGAALVSPAPRLLENLWAHLSVP